MADKSTSPSLEDLLGGMDPSVRNSPQEKEEEKERVSRKSRKNTAEKNTTEEGAGSSTMSLDDLLNESSDPSSSSLHIQEAHKKNESLDETSSSNIFHKNFKKNASDNEELLVNIENYQGEELSLAGIKEEEREEDPFIALKKKEEENFIKKEKKVRKLFVIAQASIVFGILSLVISFLIFSFLLDTPSKGVFGNFITNNYGIELEVLTEKISDMKSEELSLKKDIKKSKKIIKGFKHNSVLESIIDDRINWLEIIYQIDKVRTDAQVVSLGNKKDKNIISQLTNPFTFENYTTKGNMKNGKIEIIISGKATDSQGYIFLKISQLIDAFNNSKYFSGATMRQYSKTQDSRVGFYMPFTMKLTYYKNGKIAEEEK